MADRPSEPSAIFWAVGVAASIALHASVVAGMALLAGRYAQASAPTEITFTDESSPAVDPLKGKAERTQPSEVARTAEQERLAPTSSAAASVKPETEALKPIATEVASRAETVPAAPAAVEALPADRPETVAAARPDTVTPAAAAPTAPESQAERPATQVGSDTIAAARDSDRVASSSTPDTASAVPGETADRTIPEQQPATPVGSDTVAAAQSAERLASSSTPDAASTLPGETADRTVAEQQPAVADQAPAVVADRPKPETSAAAGTPTTATPLTGEPAQRVAALDQPASAGATPATAADKPQPTAPAETVTALPSPVSGAEALKGAAPEKLRPTAPARASGTRVAAPPGGLETSQPIAPSGETVTGAAPEAVVPSGQTGDTDGGSTTVAPTLPETVQPAEGQKEIALLVPARPNSVLGNEVDKPSDRYRKIVDFIREYTGDDCFIALPAVDPEGDVTFQTFGRDKAREDDFRKALQGIDALRTEISSGDVADPQCLALSFARATKRYPGFSLVIDLDEAEMSSGAKLSGSVLNAEGRDLHLLLVDDEGKVQSIDSFLSAGTGTDRAFSVPLTLTGGKPVATKQILLAITTDPPLPELATINEPADVFFRRLAKEIKVMDADVDLAVEGFNVR